MTGIFHSFYFGVLGGRFLTAINSTILKDIIKRIKIHEVPSLAAQLAYYLLLSMFPFLLFLISLAGHMPVTGEHVIDELGRILPDNTFETIRQILAEITTGRNTAFSFSLVTSLWAASKGVNALIRGLNKAYDINESRPFWKTRVISVLYTLGLAILLIITMVFIVLGKPIGDYISDTFGLPPRFFNTVWNWIRHVTPVLAMIITLAALYYFIPDKRLSLRTTFPGAVFTTVVWMVLSVAFSFYVNNFSSYSKVYGSIGGIIVLLIWLYWISMIILIGGEINAALVHHHSSRKRRISRI